MVAADICVCSERIRMQRRVGIHGNVRNSSSNSAFVIANLCLRYIALMLAMLPNISPLQEQTQAICNNDSLQVMSASVRIGVQWNAISISAHAICL